MEITEYENDHVTEYYWGEGGILQDGFPGDFNHSTQSFPGESYKTRVRSSL